MSDTKVKTAINFVITLYRMDIITNEQLDELAYDLFDMVKAT